MKSISKQSLMKRVHNQSSFTTTCKPFDIGTSYQLLHRTIWRHLSIVLFLLLSIGVGLGTATAQVQSRAYVTTSAAFEVGDFVSVIDTATNTVVVTINFPISHLFGVAITPDETRAYVTTGQNTVSISTPRPTPWLRPFLLGEVLLG